MGVEPRLDDEPARDPVVVVCSNLSTNCLGRALLLAELAAPRHAASVAGFVCDDHIWQPALDSSIPIRSYPLTHVGQFSSAARWLRQHIAGKKLIVSKPLATSLGLSLLAGARPKQIVLDNDDWELGMRRSAGPHGHRERARELLDPGAINSYGSTWAFDRIATHFPNRIASNSWLARRFGGVVLPHVRDTSFLDPEQTDRDSVRAELGMTGRLWVGFIGTPRPHKGIDALLEALGQLDGDGPGLYLAGVDVADPYGAELLERARSTVGERRLVVKGLFPFAELPRWVSAADIICLPSGPDPAARGQLPAKLFDAMAMAKPIVAADVNDMARIIDGRGIVVKPADVATLRDALLRLIGDEELRRRLGEGARQRAISSYSYHAGRRILSRTLAAVQPVGTLRHHR